MKILATSDIHQAPSKWKDLIKVCQTNPFDIIIIAGDLFPKDTRITDQAQFFPKIIKYAKKIKDTGAKLVLMLGNDDNQRIIPMMEKADQDGLLHFVSEKVIEIDGHEFIGMPYVPDYPFGYKFWCRGETSSDLRMSSIQYCDPLLVNDQNKMTTIQNYAVYLREKKKIWDVLMDLKDQVKNMSKSIWLIHAPPSNLNLDVCANGHRVGSHAVLKFIKENQPLLTIHGHIHESPHYNGYVWFNNVEKTICVQSGQIDYRVYYSTIDIQDGNIIYMKHSIYGDDLWNNNIHSINTKTRSK